jgi:hypothetical protein
MEAFGKGGLNMGKQRDGESYTVHDDKDWRFDTDGFTDFNQAADFAESHGLTKMTVWVDGDAENGAQATLEYRDRQWHDVSHYGPFAKFWVPVTRKTGAKA